MPTEDEMRDLFSAANPESGPALGFGPEEIAARGARVHRRRRRWAAVASAVAVLAVAGLLVTTLSRPRVEPAAPGTVTVTTHTATPPPTVSTTATTTAPVTTTQATCTALNRTTC